MRLLILAAAILSFPFAVHAQIDLSSQLLLRPKGTSTPREAGLESGRYKIRKTKNLPEKKIPGTEVDTSATVGNASVVLVPDTTTTTTTSTTTSSTTLKATPKKNAEMEKILFSPTPAKAAQSPVEKPVEPVETKTSVVEPTVGEQVREIVLGSQLPEVEAYKEQIHPDDIRLNRIEVDILPGVLSDTSKSNYSFRNYNTFSPKILVGARLWMTPFLGLYGNYTTSMGGDVMDDANTRSRSTAQHEWTELGLDIRRFFGMSRKSNSLQFGFHLSEYKFTVPGDDEHRIRLRSSGVGLHLLSRIPVAPSYSWIFGGKIIPRVQHAELGTGLNLSSGSAGESTRVDLIVGGEFKMARQNQILWDLTTSFEKNQFNGQANVEDPETGGKPNGVSVENTILLFSLGYRWGQ